MKFIASPIETGDEFVALVVINTGVNFVVGAVDVAKLFVAGVLLKRREHLGNVCVSPFSLYMESIIYICRESCYTITLKLTPYVQKRM